MSAYADLTTRFARLARLDDALGILQWDVDTMMPNGASESRGETLATLKVLRHELLTDPRIGDLLGAADGDGDVKGDAWRAANVRLMRRAYVHATAVPGDLVEALSRAISKSEMTWRAAKPKNDWASLVPALSENLRLSREVAQAKAQKLGLGVYDTLVDSYEPGLPSARIDAVFDPLAKTLPGLIDEVLAAQAKKPPILPVRGPFPVEKQRALGLRVMKALGFDFARGRLDVSLHPFCGGGDDDVRITTRYDEHDFLRALFGVCHETGHALYEQGRPRAWRDQPVGLAGGMAMHESQSLLVEMQASRSREMLQFLAPLIREELSGTGPAFSDENLFRTITLVERSLIRVDADEVTYPAHVILRYRLERALVDGSLALVDVPGAWNEAMRTLLGVVPTTDTEGCMQDIHWPAGLWGYFPTYTLGAMAAAQLFDAAKRALPELLAGLSQGELAPLVGWLRTNVHEKGQSMSTEEILVAATGRGLDPKVFESHLRTRYLG